MKAPWKTRSQRPPSARAAGENEPRVDVALTRPPPEIDDVETLLELATLAHARLLPSGLKQSA